MNDNIGTRASVVFGFIFALLIPLIGFIFGVILTLTAKPGEPNHGPAIIIASLLGALLWLAIGL